MKKIYKLGLITLVLAVLAVSGLVAPHAVYASGENVSQTDCDSGGGINGSSNWDDIAPITRPVIASMSVDGENVPDPTSPANGSIGASVCPGDSPLRAVVINVFKQQSGSVSADLTGAVTPAGHPITSSSHITITINDMGSQAKYMTFPFIHGVVSGWTTANLGTDSASFSLTFSPARMTELGGEHVGFCSATPPDCTANQSDYDILGASLDMQIPQDGYASNMTGSYFALVSAVGGWVEVKDSGPGTPNTIVATLGAPHFLSDGVTRNVGSMQAFLPTSILENLLGLSAGSIDSSTLSVTRTESSDTSSVPFTLTAVDGGYIISVSDITFSSPVYTIKKAATSDSTSPSGSTSPGAPNTGYGAPANPVNDILPMGLLLLGGAGLVIAARKFNRQQAD